MSAVTTIIVKKTSSTLHNLMPGTIVKRPHGQPPMMVHAIRESPVRFDEVYIELRKP